MKLKKMVVALSVVGVGMIGGLNVHSSSSGLLISFSANKANAQYAEGCYQNSSGGTTCPPQGDGGFGGWWDTGYDDYDYDGDGSGGGSSSGGSNNSVDNAKKYTECLKKANASHANCLTDTTAIDAAHAVCTVAAAKAADNLYKSMKASSNARVRAMASPTSSAFLVAETVVCDYGKSDSIDGLPGFCEGIKNKDFEDCEKKYG